MHDGLESLEGDSGPRRLGNRVRCLYFFFFQAEDGIRDYKVTGVQTCALPISGSHRHRGRLPVDWVYLVAAFQDLYRQSRTPEPGRLLVTVIKAVQSTDPTADRKSVV